jgi:hypothetical protein
VVTFRGFHGTSAAVVKQIRQRGLLASDNDDDWLGGGTYFFVDGLADPRDSAFEWARCKAWDKAAHRFRHTEFALIEAEIAVADEAVFDLREAENAREFHRARQRWIDCWLPKRSTHLPRPAGERYDTVLLDRFKQDAGIGVLIANFHLQLSIRERHFRFDSRIPNVSVLCVSDPQPVTVTTEIKNIEILPETADIDLEDHL